MMIRVRAPITSQKWRSDLRQFGSRTIRVCLCLLALGPLCRSVAAQDWLTPDELEKLRLYQSLNQRVDFYMKIAETRLEATQSRLRGKSSPEGDPLEFMSQVELISGCRAALRASMMSIQDYVSYKKLRGPELSKSLKKLKKTSESFLPPLKKILAGALQRRDEPLARATHACIQFAESAVRGVKDALEKYKDHPPAKNAHSAMSRVDALFEGFDPPETSVSLPDRVRPVPRQRRRSGRRFPR